MRGPGKSQGLGKLLCASESTVQQKAIRLYRILSQARNKDAADDESKQDRYNRDQYFNKSFLNFISASLSRHSQRNFIYRGFAPEYSPMIFPSNITRIRSEISDFIETALMRRIPQPCHVPFHSVMHKLCSLMSSPCRMHRD